MSTYVPQRGIDFDDFIGTNYFAKRLGLENVQFRPVLVKANDKHEDFIGIGWSGYDTVGDGIYKSGLMFPTKNFTEADVKRLFNKVETEEGVVYQPKADLAIDQVYIRVCYSREPEKADTIKWVSAVEGGELFTLSGEKRVYVPAE